MLMDCLCCCLQEIATAYSVRVTFLSGDVHVGAFGCFQAHPKQHIRVIDPKFMLQVMALLVPGSQSLGHSLRALSSTAVA